MATVSASTSLEKLMLPEAARHDLKKSSGQIFYENRKCLMLCFCLYGCSFFSGYEGIISGSFINYESFIDRFGVEFQGRKEIDVNFQQGIRVAGTMGSLLANLVQWWFSERFLGRIRLVQIGLIFSVMAVGLQVGATNTATFCVARFFMGLSEAIVRYGIFLWVAESTIAPIRCAASGIFSIKCALGGLTGQGVSRVFSKGKSVMHYKLPLYIGLGPQILSVLLLFLLPESPRWLLLKDRPEDARKTLTRLRSGEHCTDPAIDSELAAMQAAIQLERESREKHREQLGKTSGSLLFKLKQTRMYNAFVGTNRLRTLASAVAGTFFVMSGFDFSVTGQTYILRVFGESDPFKYACIASACGLVGAILNVAYVAENVTRRKLIFWGFLTSAACMLAIGTAFVVPGAPMASRRNVLSAFVSVLCFINNVSVSNIAHAVANEIPAQEYRSVTMVFHWLTYWISTTIQDVVQPYWINVTKFNLGGKIAWLYFVTCIIATIVCYFLIPESRGVTLEEMDLLYNAKVSPRKSAQWIREYRQRIVAGEGGEDSKDTKTPLERLEVDLERDDPWTSLRICSPTPQHTPRC